MDLIASFHSHKIKKFHFFSLSGLSTKGRDIVFLFDTGAVCPVIGVNCLFPKDDNAAHHNKRESFEKLLREEIKIQSIGTRPRPLKAANNQEVTTYPCVCRDVSISNAGTMDFYFDISFDDISIPLLGSSFIDDCAYTHSIAGSLNITGIKESAGKDFYTGMNILDFNRVLERFK
ncbi:MAG: hypothetical protein J5819_09900 [Eubacterium sp.]|nr:hypothetical protein [Eubacterium sp.]